MDDRRFDSIVKAMATGSNRRSLFKGLLGLGGAAVVGTSLREREVNAARRPTPTPKPVTCPGQQTWNGTACVCPGSAPDKCGPDCCNEAAVGPTHSECCDNACCFGTCYGEELCCPTNTRPGGLPPTHIICEGPTGPTCVPGNCCDDSDCGDPCQVCNLQTHTCAPRCPGADEVCCTEQAGPGVCVTGECCPGAPCGEEQVCCEGLEGAVCCPGGEICQDGQCAPPCQADVQIFVQTHGPLQVPGVCPGPFANVVTEVGLYPYENGVCSDTAIATATTSANGPAVFSDIPGGQYCAIPTDGSLADCLDCPNYGQGVGVDLTIPCSGTFQWTIGVDSCCVEGVSVSIFAGANNGECGQSGTISGVELGLFDCDTDALLYGPLTTGGDGRATFDGVAPGHYCAHATASSGYSGCEVCPTGGPEFDVNCPSFGGWTVLFEDCGVCQTCNDGTCNPVDSGTNCIDSEENAGICCDGECVSTEVSFVCGDGCCPIEDTCCEGFCCTGECLRYAQEPDVCCTTLACGEGEARECCPNVEDYKCCGTQGCCTSSQCNEEADVCCSEGSFACGTTEGNLCCGSATEKCCEGVCIDATECCAANGDECCVPLTCADAPQYSCPSAFPDGCGGTLDCSGICPTPQFCNSSGWCDCELGQVCTVDSDCCSTNCCNGTCIADGDPCVCTPLTCADVSPGTCPSAFDDGCGSSLDCSDVCAVGTSCLDGVCIEDIPCTSLLLGCSTSSECCSSCCLDDDGTATAVCTQLFPTQPIARNICISTVNNLFGEICVDPAGITIPGYGTFAPVCMNPV